MIKINFQRNLAQKKANLKKGFKFSKCPFQRVLVRESVNLKGILSKNLKGF